MAEVCIVIAQGLPRPDNGFGIAMYSSLKLYERAFSRVLYLCVSDEPPDSQIEADFAGVHFRHFPVHRAGYARRFIASIPTGLPACVMHMNDDRLRKELLSVVRSEVVQGSTIWCIVENLAPTVFIPALKEQFPTLNIVYRSHDVSELAFAPLAKNEPWPIRWAWAWELARIHRLEARTLVLVQRMWTITPDDASAYARLHVRPNDAVLSVQIDIERYSRIPAGAQNRLLYLGSSDIRKAKGLYRFLSECWPLVRQQYPEVELWIGGPGTERFAQAATGIRAFGFVDDEMEFLGLGRALINPQEAGTGIKLKSLVAMAAGKLLISTSNGVMGIEGGESGQHYLASDSPGEMAQHIGLLMTDPDRVETIAAAGRKLVCAKYDISDHITHDLHLARLLGRVS